MNSKDNECAKSKAGTTSKVFELSSINQKQFFDIKQILKLNNDQTSKFYSLTKIPEDNNPQFSLEKAPTDSKLGPNDRTLIPMNQFINDDQSVA